jgi:putative endonuclease
MPKDCGFSKMQRHKKSHERGLWAERLCVLALRLKGYGILARRWKNPAAEIDILALKKDVLVLVEVKERKTSAEAYAAISPGLRRRLAMAGRFALAHWPELREHSLRFDAMLVTPWHWPVHIENAWQDEKW